MESNDDFLRMILINAFLCMLVAEVIIHRKFVVSQSSIINNTLVKSMIKFGWSV